MQSAKETATNVAASAKSGLDKTKATMQEKAERMTSRDPLQKEMATEKKDARINEAERQKHETREAAKAGRIHGNTTGYGGTGYGSTGYGTHGSTGYGSTGTGYSNMTEAGYPSETTGTQGLGSQYPPTSGTTGGAGRTGVKDPKVHRSGAHRDTDTY